MKYGTLFGKTETLAKALRKGRTDIRALQEIPYCGAKSCDIERKLDKNDYLFYIGSPHTQYSVAIAISECFCNAIKAVEQFDDRSMKLTVISVDRTIHFFTAYPPPTGQTNAEKDSFWQPLNTKTCDVPDDDNIVIAENFNVYGKAGGDSCHEGKGLKSPMGLASVYSILWKFMTLYL